MDKVTLKKKINDLFIVREDDGTYNLFGKFYITPESTNLYRVNVAHENDTYLFSSLRNAVTWCVFQKNDKKKETNRIAELDALICNLDVQIAQHTRLYAKAENTDKYIYSAKLTENRVRKKEAVREIEEYANTSRYLQSKKFAENMNKN